MITRTFRRDELQSMEIPPSSPRDVEYREDVYADEHVRNLKYTQIRRCVFEAPDSRTYAIEYEAPVDTGDFEVGGGPVENHGWGETVQAVEVELRPVAVRQWMPATDESAQTLAGGEDTIQEQLAETYVESGCRDGDSRRLAAETLAAHTRELAAFLTDIHPDAAGVLLGHARDLDGSVPTDAVDQDKADGPEDNYEADSDLEVLEAIGDIATRLLDATDEGEYHAVALISDLVESRKTVAEARAELAGITFRHI